MVTPSLDPQCAHVITNQARDKNRYACETRPRKPSNLTCMTRELTIEMSNEMSLAEKDDTKIKVRKAQEDSLAI